MKVYNTERLIKNIMKIFKNKTIDQIKDQINRETFPNNYFITFAGHETNGYIVWKLYFCNCHLSDNPCACSACGAFVLTKMAWFIDLKSAIQFMEEKNNYSFVKDGFEIIKLDNTHTLVVSKKHPSHKINEDHEPYYSSEFEKFVLETKVITEFGLEIRLMSNSKEFEKLYDDSNRIYFEPLINNSERVTVKIPCVGQTIVDIDFLLKSLRNLEVAFDSSK